MRLNDMINQLAPLVKLTAGDEQTAISSVTADSRLVTPGALFAALSGSKSDGSQFITTALAKGAVAILAATGQVPANQLGNAALLESAEPRQALARMASLFFPGQPRHVAAVTGTNGKSSTAQFYAQLWHLLGRPAASLGTLGLAVLGAELPAPPHSAGLTTPDPVRLHQDLQMLAELDVQYLGVEASSHGLDQRRLDGVQISAAAFTNLSRDHLDYHGTMEHYFAAKSRLFHEVLADGGAAWINADDAYGQQLLASPSPRGQRLYSYGQQGRDITLVERVALPHGQRAKLRYDGNEYDVQISLIGDFQLYNIMAAMGLALSHGANFVNLVAVLPRLSGVRGRLELAGRTELGAAVYVDYAHTPDALALVLRALRPHTSGRLYVVFGCGGDRDTGKRAEMGRVASAFADQVIVTDDNPRSEDPALIRAAIMAAAPAARDIAGRDRAIALAVAELQAGDVLVIAGKGHESGQIIGATTLPMDDVQLAKAAIAAGA